MRTHDHKVTSCLAVIAATLVMAGVGCSSSKSGSTGATGSSSGQVTVGLLTDVSGLGASGNKTSVQGVEAGVSWVAKHEGIKIKYVVGDTATSPGGALNAAQRMVTQDHVTAVLAVSALAFGAAPYLTQHGVPVIGVAEDANEWNTSPNMFSIFGYSDPSLVTTGLGVLMKMEGGTNLGSIGYSVSPGSEQAAKAAAVSAEAAGLKAGYVDEKFPFGSTNVEPVVLAMKAAGIDSFTAATDPNTAFAFITSLRQEGINLKFALLDDGYGGDLLTSGPGAAQAAQGVYFLLGYEPVELHTAATKQFVGALQSVGVATEPTFAEYNGYISVLLLAQALQAAGSHPSQASLLAALKGIHAFDAGGLFGGQKLDVNNKTHRGNGLLACSYVTKFVGSTFQLVPHADPLCSSIIPGKSVSAS